LAISKTEKLTSLPTTQKGLHKDREELILVSTYPCMPIPSKSIFCHQIVGKNEPS